MSDPGCEHGDVRRDEFDGYPLRWRCRACDTPFSPSLPALVVSLRQQYEERYAELERVMEARKALPPGAESRRLFEKRSEQIEYLFGCLDGVRNAIHLLDPSLHFHGWRNFGTWEASLETAGA